MNYVVQYDKSFIGLHFFLYFQAFSKVVQKLVPQLPTLENLLNILISVSGNGV